MLREEAASVLASLALLIITFAGCDAGTATTDRSRSAGDMGDSVMKDATFAAGCFWHVEAAFLQVEGVADVESGYTGGATENPIYREVCAGGTGHAEAVHVTYDPKVVSYNDLLDVFWKIHDPTQLNRQGPDVGGQYRSAIFCHTPQQREAALASKAALEESGRFKHPVVTVIEDAGPFWRAEEYHQRYFEKHGMACRVNL
jgi:peptide-methionine (S)-S-oxide reductase